MELELQHKTVEGYSAVYHAEFGQEETLESIVPDSFPDVSRIISASGNVFLKDKEAEEGTLQLTGTVFVTVLYIPDGEEVPRALEINMPFRSSRDCPHIHQGMPIHGSVSVSFADARMINPRKILVRSSLFCAVDVYEKVRQELTCDVSDCQEGRMEKQFMNYNCHVISELAEKSFVFSDVLRLAASKPNMDELISFRFEMGSTDAKVIGKKLVCKGEFQLNVLYRNAGNLIPVRFDLPFSQIVELMNVMEDGVPSLSVTLKTMECDLRDGALEVTAEALIQCAVWVQTPVAVMSDTYCTSCVLETERSPHSLCVSAEPGKRRGTARQFCESGIPGKQVLDCRTAILSLSTEEGREGTVCRAQCNVDVLYLSEDDALCAVNYTVPVECELPSGNCHWSCRPVGEATAVPVTGGFEVRFEAEFSWMKTDAKTVLCVDAVRHGVNPGGAFPRPSVVIRPVNESDSLWEIAKACGSTVRDICVANSLQSETISGSTVLLIPSRRD